MGLFTNPLGYAGYNAPAGNGSGTFAPAQQINTTVRAATTAEAEAGALTNVYIAPATLSAAASADFASPPLLGFGSTTPRPVAATTLSSTLNTTLATAAAATSFTALSAIFTTGTQTVGFFDANSSGGTQIFNVLKGTRAGTINLGTGAAAHVLNLGSSVAKVGFFGQTAALQQTLGAITNNVTVGGTTGTLANFTDLTVYANDSTAIQNDIYQLGLAVSGIITALKAYGISA